MRTVFSLVIGVVLLFDSYWSCDPRQEYIAHENDFRQYASWRVIDYTIGQSNPLLGGAHRGNDERYSRRVYINSQVKNSGSGFPAGTIIVKETFLWKNGEKEYSPSDGILAMVKRGKRFNPAGNGWEWFFLSRNGRQIVNRGGSDLGMCNICHRYAVVQEGGRDYVFVHPTEFICDGAEFPLYRQWNKINTLDGPDPFLQTVEDPDDPSATRRVYKKQLLANPDFSEYPVGVMYVKEIIRQGFLTDILAQVKRGGDFNPENGNWEWFIIEPESFVIKSRGANLADGACNRCHARANAIGDGVDFVYHHPGDPFN